MSRPRTVGFFQRRLNLVLNAAQAIAAEKKSQEMNVSVSRYIRYLIECDTGVGIDEGMDTSQLERKPPTDNYASSWADGLEKSK